MCKRSIYELYCPAAKCTIFVSSLGTVSGETTLLQENEFLPHVLAFVEFSTITISGGFIEKIRKLLIEND